MSRSGSDTPRPTIRWRRPLRRTLTTGINIGLSATAYVLAFLLRFDLAVDRVPWRLVFETLPLLLAIRVAVFFWFRLNGGMWRYVAMRDVLDIVKGVSAGSVLFAGAVVLSVAGDVPLSVVAIDWPLCLVLVGGIRLAIRWMREADARRGRPRARPVIVVGAGNAGEAVIREVERSPALAYRVVGFADDDPLKIGRRLHSVQVFGSIDALPEIVRRQGAEEILIAIPSATPAQRRRIVEKCRATALPFKSMPPLQDLLLGRARIDQMHEVTPEDVLGRDRVSLDRDLLGRELRGKRVLVTGGAGSIGSEIVRQVAVFEPELLVLLDRAESNLHDVSLEIRDRYPALNIVPIVGDVCDRAHVEEVVARHEPHLVYHAAAYKHVHLMEEQPLAAVANNVFGTANVAEAAMKTGVAKFVLISTDKAVRPVGIMGLTKRLAECLLLSFNVGSTSFVSVRFGNVLGSAGSVLPTFQRQIALGRPLTITDPDAYRYFMLISEAAQLVLQAGALGKGGEVFFLDMGEPVRVMDIARNLVSIAGLELGKDVQVRIDGLRPGERLREALVADMEDLEPAQHPKVLVVRGSGFNREAFLMDLDVLRECVSTRNHERCVAQLRRMGERY
ncbi:MAG: polysaccharide biosynthesis protein [Candidatus Rokubacteria bacterium]|nr:polysaccharide biosynthesis protein [Candidatus Rokubacteria bacterium]